MYDCLAFFFMLQALVQCLPGAPGPDKVLEDLVLHGLLIVRGSGAVPAWGSRHRQSFGRPRSTWAPDCERRLHSLWVVVWELPMELLDSLWMTMWEFLM